MFSRQALHEDRTVVGAGFGQKKSLNIFFGGSARDCARRVRDKTGGSNFSADSVHAVFVAHRSREIPFLSCGVRALVRATFRATLAPWF